MNGVFRKRDVEKRLQRHSWSGTAGGNSFLSSNPTSHHKKRPCAAFCVFALFGILRDVMSEPLIALFDTQARVRILRLFLFNPSLAVSMHEVLRRAKLSQRAARTELTQLERAKIIKRKVIFEEVNGKRRKMQGYALNPDTPVAQSLQTFLFETAPINGKTLQKHLRGVGKVQVLVAAGAFLREFDRRLDVLIGVDVFKPTKIEVAMRNLEAELGIGIKYAAFSTSDLLYRISMHDKLIRDVFDYPHQVVVDKIHVQDEIKRP